MPPYVPYFTGNRERLVDQSKIKDKDSSSESGIGNQTKIDRVNAADVGRNNGYLPMMVADRVQVKQAAGPFMKWRLVCSWPTAP